MYKKFRVNEKNIMGMSKGDKICTIDVLEQVVVSRYIIFSLGLLMLNAFSSVFKLVSTFV